MKIKNIYIRDFGIFNNQKLNDLADGIIFIGGHNRAGKSSFLDIIRHLGYGLPQDGSIPPADDEYYIQADLTKGKKQYSLIINGYAKPKIGAQSAEDISVSNLYNNLDKFSYQQLFTISLEELQTISRITGGNRDQKRLYSVLLGAGLSGLVRVPEIAQSYFNKAANIGGKEGRTSVYSFKPYHSEITAAEKEKEEALKEVDQFIEIENKLSSREEEKNQLNKKISSLEKEEFLLDILKNNYQEYEKVEKLKFSLSENFDSKFKADNFNDKDLDAAVELKAELLELEEKKAELENKIVKKSSRDKKEGLIKSLLSSENILEKYKSKKDVLAERIQVFLEQKEDLEEKRSHLESEAAQLNSNWEEPLEKIDKIETDNLIQSEISRNLESYRKLKSELEDIKEKENDLKDDYQLKQKKIKQYEGANPKLILKKIYAAATAAVLFASAVTFFDFNFGIYISFAFLLIIYIYYSSNYKDAKDKEVQKNVLENDISVLEKKIEEVVAEYERKNKKADELEEIIDMYRRKLEIKDDKALDVISDYYRTLQDKKSRLDLLKKDEKRLLVKKNEINKELEQILKAVENTAAFAAEGFFDLGLKKDEKHSLIDFYRELFIEFDKALETLDLVKDFKELNEQSKQIKKEAEELLKKAGFEIDKKITSTLNEFIEQAEIFNEYLEVEADYLSRRKQLKYTLNNSSDKIRNYLLENFKENADKIDDQAELNSELYLDNLNSGEVTGEEIKIDQKEKIIQSFIILYKEFPSLEAVENRYKKTAADFNSTTKKIKELEEEINSLEIKAEQLASSQKVEQANQKINQARTKLRSLAERYAVNKSVYYILKKLRERIISRAEEELLSPAADILARITENEYQAIQTADNLEEAEFRTFLSDGSSVDSVSHLSRGTMEQLFLAVRLSRIKEIQPPLPIVIDDSLVNFDRSHLYNAADVISELGESHQVFILSCHPHFAEFLDSFSDNIQYWMLKKGIFNRSSAAEVINHLKKI